MGFWERIKALFGIKPAPNPAIKTPQSATKPPPGTVLSTTTVPADDTVPLPGGAAVDLIRLLFSKKDKYTTTMLNSISLSSDMKTLYLIDNGRAIAYDLTVPQGVLIGLLGEQLVVATAIALPTPDDTLDPNVEEGVDLAGAAVTTDDTEIPTPSRPVPRKYTFKAGKDSQYTVNYNRKNKALSIIGHDDLVVNLQASSDCSSKIFYIDNKRIVRILNKEDTLEISELR